MKLLFVLPCLLVSGYTLPTERGSNHVLHEKRSQSTSSLWRRTNRVDPDAIIPLRIGLTQTNLDDGYDHLLAVSHPDSPRYGQHFSAEEVHAIFAPAKETVASVRSWLMSSGGLLESDIVYSENRGWLALEIPAKKAEAFFLAEIHEYEHSKTGHLRLGCEKYHVPHHLEEHIDYITPGVKFSAALRKRSSTNSPLDRPVLRSSVPRDAHHPPTTYPLPPDLRHCATNITTACIRALYNIPVPTIANQANAPGFYEQGDWYSQANLNLYFEHLAPQIPVGTQPIKALIDGAIDPVGPNSKLSGIEAVMDLEVAFGLVYPTIPVVYQVDDTPDERREIEHNNLFNTFLDAIDGSYCNYTTFGIHGDSWQDPKFPDPKKKGYKGKLQCGVYKPTRVISISYGEAESDIPERYDKRQCSEFMKLALQGHTILEASGDYGVASFPGDGGKDGCLGKHGKVFNPDYLSGCPFITSVGATMLEKHQTVEDEESAMYITNATIPDLGKIIVSSTGGFSNYFSRPKYQEEAVRKWFEEHDPGYPTYVANAKASNIGQGGGLYNRAGRAFPDVSANGAFILGYAYNETLGHHFGTSFSSPIWASVISLINQQRSLAGKKPVGFINPVLYQYPWAMNDIKSGSNPGCHSTGFEAVDGWDPVTGLGAPNYPRLLEAFMKLP